jgi:hypothetical protein
VPLLLMVVPLLAAPLPPPLLVEPLLLLPLTALLPLAAPDPGVTVFGGPSAEPFELDPEQAMAERAATAQERRSNLIGSVA